MRISRTFHNKQTGVSYTIRKRTATIKVYARCNAFVSASGDYMGGRSNYRISCELRLGHKDPRHLAHHRFDTELQFRWATPRVTGRWVTERMSPRVRVSYFKQGAE
jgi:hypothetical protein